ncbi:MAG: hypothetical protein M1541_04340 [Acidobacteria bacterium]|nr:hypothetical protein [Acidobacteriota bacterium]
MGFIENGVFIAIIAHGLIGLSLVWDKVLLRRPETQNLLSYVFWLGAISILGLLLIPFGFRMPEVTIAGLAFGTGALQLLAIGFYYGALARGEASETLAIMGGFSPLATALIAIPLLRSPIGGRLLEFVLLTSGGFAMFLSERLNLKELLPRILLASGLFGLVNVLQKVVFDHTNFVSGYVFFTFGTFFAAILLLARQMWRKQIFETSESASPRSRFWYFVNRFSAGVGSFLIYYAISLENPAIVDAITAVRYLLIFLGALLLTKFRPDWLTENFGGWSLFWKIASTLLVVAGLVLLGLHDGGQGVGVPG